MATVTFKGKEIHLNGNLPKSEAKAPDFHLIKSDLSEVSLNNYNNKKKVLSVFPSVDTPVCAMALKKFYKELNDRGDIVFLNVSKDLPFAQNRFCAAEGIKNAEMLSAFRSSFARDYGLEIAEGPLAGLCARAVFVLDENNKVIYSEIVPEISHEPNYDSLLAALK